MTTYCLSCKNKECSNYGKSIMFGWSCEKYINNVYTNADHIREMNDKELAEFFAEGIREIEFCHAGACLDDETCADCMLKWLLKPMEKE